MSQSRAKSPGGRPAPRSDTPSTASAGVTAVAALCVPGAGHLMQRQARKAAVFAVVLIAMFVIGLSFGGRLFPFQVSDPLVFLAAAAEWAIVGPRAVATLAGAGTGDVVAITYEYGNTFLIASGLLNLLVTLDAMDLASGRKAT
jgi:hypothetical protein